MPLYTTQCGVCSLRQTIYRRIADRNDLPFCECGGYTFRILETPAVHAEVALFTPYRSPITNEIVTTREQRKREMKAHGKIDWEPGIRDQIAKRAAECDAIREAKIDATVDYLVRDMNLKGKFDDAPGT